MFPENHNYMQGLSSIFYLFFFIFLIGLVIRGANILLRDKHIKVGIFFNEPQLLPYSKKKYFLTSTERQFYSMLCEWFQDKYYIFPQVHISSLIDVSIEKRKPILNP